MYGSVDVPGGRWDYGDVFYLGGASAAGERLNFLTRSGISRRGCSRKLCCNARCWDKSGSGLDGAAGVPHTTFLADTGTGAGAGIAGSTELMYGDEWSTAGVQ